MKKTLLLLLLLLPLAVWGQRNVARVSALPPFEASARQGLSGMYAGMVDGRPVIAGGANFPHVAAAEGGTKEYYDGVWTLEGDRWQALPFRLPRRAAYGASVTLPDGVMLIGGTGDDAPDSVGRAVWLLTRTGLKAMPSLPYPMHDHCAALWDGTVYVLGGDTLNDVLALRPGEDTRWRTIAHMPGTTRSQATASVQNGATTAGLYILGGYDAATDTTAAHVYADGLRLDLTTHEWTRTAPMPAGVTLCGAQSAPSGCAHIVCLGGVDKDIFERRINQVYQQPRFEEEIERCLDRGDSASIEAAKALLARLDDEIAADKQYMYHPAAWYRFRADLLVYHTITDTWTTLAGDTLLSRAGASLVADGGRLLLLGGETMPGLRGTSNTSVELQSTTRFGALNWMVLALYLLAMLALGYYFMRRAAGSDDFFKGGGRIPWWAAGISIYATMLSAITYMAIPAKAYATNWTYYPMLVTILVVGFPVVKYYLPFFRRLNVTSAYEYLEHRFSLTLRLLASALFIIFMVARMALVLYLPSLALSAVTGIDIYLCIVLMSLVTIVYCTMGGVEAVVWGDVVQGIILVGGAIFAAVYLVLQTDGGFMGTVQLALEDDKLRLFEWSWDYRTATFWVVILGGLANNLISYTSDQTVIQRYLTTKDERSAGRSIMMNGIMSVVISVAFYAIGTGLYTFYKTHPAALDVTMAKGDAILPFFMMSQMPSGVAGLLIAAIFAATMSTISSNINSIATAFSIDFYRRFRRSASDASVVRVARRACVVSGLIGLGLALVMVTWNILSLLDYFNTILGLLSSGLGGLFLMGIFMPRIDGRAALVGFLSGTAAVFALQAYTEVTFLIFGFVGMAVSVVVGLAASLVFRNRRDMTGLTR